MTTITVISHFYNEEFLLPYWLKYHTKLFDHGIMIDYQSTDRSVNIIKELAPNWEIRPSRYTEFDARKIDREVEEIEQTISGWKIALNTTEFLLYHNLRTYCNQFEQDFPHLAGIRTAGVWIMDAPNEYNTPVDDRPLFFQRYHGGMEHRSGSRHRLFHNAPSGHYHKGRHWTKLRNVIYEPRIYCLWFGWSPYPQVKPRKMQIQTRIPAKYIGTDEGKEHQLTSEEMDNQFWIWSKGAKNLLEDENYKKALELVRQHLYD